MGVIRPYKKRKRTKKKNAPNSMKMDAENVMTRPDTKVQVIFRMLFTDYDKFRMQCAMEKQTVQSACAIFAKAYARGNKEIMRFMRKHVPAKDKALKRKRYGDLTLDEQSAIFAKLQADSPLADAFINVDKEYADKDDT